MIVYASICVCKYECIHVCKRLREMNYFHASMKCSGVFKNIKITHVRGLTSGEDKKIGRCDDDEF